jgi:hypothetical protein
MAIATIATIATAHRKPYGLLGFYHLGDDCDDCDDCVLAVAIASAEVKAIATAKPSKH